jgi:hypothetical protein
VGMKELCWLSIRISCTSGKLVAELLVEPDDPSEKPVKPVPVRDRSVLLGDVDYKRLHGGGETQPIVIQLGAAENATVTPPGDEYQAVGQERRGVPLRAVVMLPVAVKVPVAGLYNSALLRTPLLLNPPAISTRPLGKSVAVVYYARRGHAAGGSEGAGGRVVQLGAAENTAIVAPRR